MSENELCTNKNRSEHESTPVKKCMKRINTSWKTLNTKQWENNENEARRRRGGIQ